MSLPTFISEPVSVAAAALFALSVLVVFVVRNNRPWLSRIQRKSLLSPNERHFFYRLQRALPSHHVFPQVSFAAILTDDGMLPRRARWSLRARFDRKICDFVICERESLKIIALVELDDSTHVARADRQRDGITKAAGYHTIRFESKRKPSEAEIASLFQHARAWE